jgi:hypothetical protein
MQVFVKTPVGQTLALDVNANTSVASLKSLIAQGTAIP